MFKKKNKYSVAGGKARWAKVGKKKRSELMKALRARALKKAPSPSPT